MSQSDDDVSDETREHMATTQAVKDGVRRSASLKDAANKMLDGLTLPELRILRQRFADDGSIQQDIDVRISKLERFKALLDVDTFRFLTGILHTLADSKTPMSIVATTALLDLDTTMRHAFEALWLEAMATAHRGDFEARMAEMLHGNPRALAFFESLDKKAG